MLSFFPRKQIRSCIVPETLALDWEGVLQSAGWFLASHKMRRDGTIVARVSAKQNSVRTRLLLSPLGDPNVRDWNVRATNHSGSLIRLFVSCGGKLDRSMVPTVCQGMFRCELGEPLFELLDKSFQRVYCDSQKPDITRFCKRHLHANLQYRLSAMNERRRHLEEFAAYIGYTNRCSYYLALLKFHMTYHEWLLDPFASYICEETRRMGFEQLEIVLGGNPGDGKRG